MIPPIGPPRVCPVPHTNPSPYVHTHVEVIITPSWYAWHNDLLCPPENLSKILYCKHILFKTHLETRSLRWYEGRIASMSRHSSAWLNHPGYLNLLSFYSLDDFKFSTDILNSGSDDLYYMCSLTQQQPKAEHESIPRVRSGRSSFKSANSRHNAPRNSRSGPKELWKRASRRKCAFEENVSRAVTRVARASFRSSPGYGVRGGLISAKKKTFPFPCSRLLPCSQHCMRVPCSMQYAFSHVALYWAAISRWTN